MEKERERQVMRAALEKIAMTPCGIPGHAVANGCEASQIAARTLYDLSGVSSEAPMLVVPILMAVLAWLPAGAGWEASHNGLIRRDLAPEASSR